MARKAKLGLPLQTLRNAPDALEGRRLRGGVVEIAPDSIDLMGRIEDRLDLDIADLTESIRLNGQRVPILVRPLGEDRYGLIYGRRRLEACRALGLGVRALVTETDGPQSVLDQLLENQERRDLSFIERALLAVALQDGDYLPEPQRSNKGIAEVLSLTEGGVSQLVGVVRSVGETLIQAIGSAPGIGRPRWDELKKALAGSTQDRAALAEIAQAERGRISDPARASDAAFLAVLAALRQPTAPPPEDPGLAIEGVGRATIRTGRGDRQMRLELTADDPAFSRWLAAEAPALIAELHRRWKGLEDDPNQ